MYNKPTLDDLFEIAEKSSLESFSQQKSFHGMLYVHAAMPGGKKGLFAFPDWKCGGDEEEKRKDTICKFIYINYKLGTLDGVVLASEAWMALEKPGYPNVEPRNRPDRQEVLLINAYDSKGNKRMCVYNIVRDGEKVSLKKDETSVTDRFSSWIERGFGLNVSREAMMERAKGDKA